MATIELSPDGKRKYVFTKASGFVFGPCERLHLIISTGPLVKKKFRLVVEEVS